MTILRRAVAALAVAVCAAASVPLPAQPAGPALAAGQLREDLRLVRTALEESHAGLYWFISREALDRRFEELDAGLREPVTAREFHRRLLPLVASLRHGHTSLDLPVQGVGYRLRLLDRAGTYFPAEVRFLDGRMYVVSDLTEGAELAPGAQIVAIDGRPASALLDTLRQYVSADGANDTFKLYQLGPGFRFHALLDLLYGPSGTYTLDVVPAPGAAPARRIVAAQAPERMAALYRERTGRDLDAQPPALGFRLVGDSAAVLTVRSFYEGLLEPGHPGFEAFFASAFRHIREAGVRDLVIDVRGNEGGNSDYPVLLYTYLADRPFQLGGVTTVASTSMSTLAYAENPPDDVRAFAASPGDFVTRAADGTWVLNREIDEERYRTYAPQPDAFTGRLHVLTDGGSFSATNIFVELVYRYHRATGRSVRFVGEQNGGDLSAGTSGGQSLVLVLPHSRLRLVIPLLGSPQHAAEAGAPPVIPDQRVVPSIQDVIAGTDPALQFVLQSIGR